MIAHPLDHVLLDDEQRMIVHPAELYARIPHNDLRTWANLRGRYVLPTVELIEWLRERIAERSAIEIGAGFGDVGRHIPIHMTDSAMQQLPEMRAYYSMLGQVPINPPPDVERLDGVRAVRKHRPSVVVACFVTQLFHAGDDNEEHKIGSSIYGVEEDALLDIVDEYIHVGNDNIHGDKRVLNRPHETIRSKWIVTRANDPSKNAIHVWSKT